MFLVIRQYWSHKTRRLNDYVNAYIFYSKYWVVAKYLMFSYLHLTVQLKPHSGIAGPQLLWKVKPSFFDLTGHQSQTFLTLTTTEEDHPKIVTFWLRPCRQIHKIWIYNLVFHPQACAVVCWHTVVNHCQNVLLFSQRHQLRLVTLCHPPFSVGSDVQRVSHRWKATITVQVQ